VIVANLRPDQRWAVDRALRSAAGHRITEPMVLGNTVCPVAGSYLVQAFCQRHGGSVN
jgi:hypothetical protein